MAEMVPESIALSSHATHGEKHVFQFLRDVLVPDEEFTVWYEPALSKKHPDFVVYGHNLGLLVMEVKSYDLDKLLVLGPKKFVVLKDGREESEDSPLEQAEKSSRDLMDRIKSYPLLCHPDGPHLGKPAIPIGYCAAFTNITRARADAKSITSVVSPTQCLFQEDFEGEPNDRTVQRQFMSRIRPCFQQRVQFRFGGLDSVQIASLRHALFPELRLSTGSSESIASLDLAQERIAKGIGAGHRILKGVVGSGKSVVVASRAKYLARCNPNWKVLVLCYNVPVARALHGLIHQEGDPAQSKRIHVTHFHGLVKQVTGASLMRDNVEPFETWEARLTEEFDRFLSQNHKLHYDAVLIDEGQDFSEDMVRSIAKLLDSKSNSLLFCYDPAQNVFDRKAPVWKQTGIMVQGKRPTLLTKCYRSTTEIVSLATRFMGFEIPTDDDFATPLFPQASDRHGKGPYLTLVSSDEELFDHILNGIEHYVGKAGYDWGDVGILYATRVEDFPLRFQRQFVARFHVEGSDKLYWVNQDSSSKHEFDLRSSNVKMCTIESSKGLEFKIVFLVGVDQMPRERRDIEVERRLVYVGLTRAQEVLHIPYRTDGKFITALNTAISR